MLKPLVPPSVQFKAVRLDGTSEFLPGDWLESVSMWDGKWVEWELFQYCDVGKTSGKTVVASCATAAWETDTEEELMNVTIKLSWLKIRKEWYRAYTFIYSKMYFSERIRNRPPHCTPVSSWVWQLEMGEGHSKDSIPRVHQSYLTWLWSSSGFNRNQLILLGLTWVPAEVFTACTCKFVWTLERDVSPLESLQIDSCRFSQSRCQKWILSKEWRLST